MENVRYIFQVPPEKRRARRWIIALFVCMILSTGFRTCSLAAAPPRLKVSGTRLVNSKSGKAVQLKGISTHGLSWFPQYVNQNAFTYMKKNWNVNTIRLAMYTAEYNGYCVGGKNNQAVLEKRIENGVRYAANAGMYVIIDWHILSDGNPAKYQSQAISFFKKMAYRYKGYSNVIYEICNEPNGGTSWNTIYNYADRIIKTIRTYDKNAVIIVGTPNWSQDVDAAARKPLKQHKNIMYALHFYAGTHGQWLRNKAQQAIKKGLPLFVSEFAICDASGNGKNNTLEGKKWISFLRQYKIPMVAWNLSNKGETSALLKASTKKTSSWKDSELSAWGKWLVSNYR